MTSRDRAASLARRRFGLLPLLVVVVVVLGYAIAPLRLPLVGEETCRAQHGIEMAASGDWIIATNQGVEILDRPPGQYWLLAAIHRWVRPLDPLTLRLSMLGVTLLTALLIWWYASFFLAPPGALLAAVAYPTMGHVFDLGRRVETDGLFTLAVAASLMVWHVGYARRWGPLRTWTLGCALAAVAALVKGTQAPVAFFGTVYLFLLIRKDWRYLWHGAHALGLLVFAGGIAVWQVPFHRLAGWEGTHLTWLQPTASRVGASLGDLLRQWTTFPFKVLGATLPWSLLLAGLLFPRFWRQEDRVRALVLFALLAAAAVFVPVWLTPSGKHRYVMPAYPFFAVLCGAVLQQALALEPNQALRRFVRVYARGLAVVLAAMVVFFVGATLLDLVVEGYWVRTFAQPAGLVAVLLLAGAGGLIVVWRAAPGGESGAVRVVFTLAALVALLFGGPVLNATAINAEDVAPRIAALRDRLPANARLVSFGRVHHKFVYWYGKAIPVIPRPALAEEVPSDLEYFAVHMRRGQELDLPFSWEEIDRLSMDRRKREDPRSFVVVGRRLR